jgi:hypothetical protein
LIIQFAEDPEWAKYLTDPPCKCGNDLGLKGGALPQYAEGSAGIAQPTSLMLAAVQVPDRADITVVMNNLTGRATARFTLTPNGYHIMVSPIGQQHTCRASLVADTKDQLTDMTVYLRTAEPLSEYNEEGACDPRVIMLRHFWARQGFPDVVVWGLRRIRPAMVLGQIALVRLATRWFTANGVFRHLGACYVVEEPDGILRFMAPRAMTLEFQGLFAPDGAQLRSF